MQIDKAKIAVVGLGYVGLPLAVEFGLRYRTVGFDIKAERIAELRKDRGMSQNDLAIKLQNYGVDIDKNAVQLLEHGHRYVRDMELYVIAKVFGVSMEDLFAGTQFDIE